MNTFAVVAILLPQLFLQVWYDGRFGGKAGWYSKPVCTKPNCRMDRYIDQLLLAQASTQSNQYVTSKPTVVTTTTPRQNVSTSGLVKQVAYTACVCNGRTCSPVTRYRTEYVTETQPAPAELSVTVLHPTPEEQVGLACMLLSPRKSEVVADLGCGDGRILKAVCSAYGCRGVGVELSASSAKAAIEACAGLPVRIYNKDLLVYKNFDTADIIYMHLYQELISSLIPRIKSGTKIVSYLHSPHPTAQQVGDFYVWIKP